MMGDDNKIRYDDKFTTSNTLNQIFEKVNSMKSDFTAEAYSAISNNCRDFVRQLDKSLDSSFDPIDSTTNTVMHTATFGWYDPTFPKGRRVP